MYIGEWIKQYREEKEMSMQQFAEACGCTKAYISLLEKVVNPNSKKPISPTIDTVKNIAKVAGLSVDEFLKVLDGEQPITVNAPKHDDFTGVSKIEELTEREHNHITQYRELSDTRKEKVDDFTDYQLHQQHEEAAQTSKALAEIVKKDCPLSSAV